MKTTASSRIIDTAVPGAIALLIGACGGEKQVHPEAATAPPAEVVTGLAMACGTLRHPPRIGS